MKSTLKIFVLLFILSSNSCKAQQMVQTPNDAHKLKTNEHQFINKPLKNLLKAIKPEKKTAGVSNEEGYQFFSFSFIDYKELKTGKYIDKKKVNVYIYVKEQIDW